MVTWALNLLKDIVYFAVVGFIVFIFVFNISESMTDNKEEKDKL